MTFDTALAEDTNSAPAAWSSTWWAAALMVVALLVLVVAPARVWLLAAEQRVNDVAVSGHYLGLWVVLGLTPTVVGIVAWLMWRRSAPRRRFVLAALVASTVGLLTMVPITPYVFAF